MSVVLTGVSDCLPSGNLVIQVQCTKTELFVDQRIGNIYMYEYSNKLCISLGEVDNDTAENLRSFLNDQDQKCLKGAASY